MKDYGLPSFALSHSVPIIVSTCTNIRTFNDKVTNLLNGKPLGGVTKQEGEILQTPSDFILCQLDGSREALLKGKVQYS
jgi:hypothetical protein